MIGPYHIDNVPIYIPEFESIIGKYDITKELWNDIDSFVLLYGDCYYTEAIIKDIINRKTNKEWLHWCCNRPNKITGKKWEEGYAHRIYNIEWWKWHCESFHDRFKKENITYTNDWVFLRHILGINLTKHQPELMREYEVDWEDETDDFDYPEDYDMFREKTGLK